MTVAVGVSCTDWGVGTGVGAVEFLGIAPEDGEGEGSGRNDDEPGKKVNIRLSLAATTTEPSVLMAI